MALENSRSVDLFLFGTLRDAELLSLVAGRPVSELRPQAATAEGRAVLRALDGDYPVLGRQEGAVAEGLILFNVTQEVYERLCFFESAFDYEPADIEVLSGGRSRPVKVFLSKGPTTAGEAAWDLAAWQRDDRALMLEIAADIMALFAQRSPGNTPVNLSAIQHRVESRVRARGEENQPVIRHSFSDDDVRVTRLARPYARFMAVEEYELTHRSFDGGWGSPLSRIALVAADAVTVLPYDPVLDKVVLIEQFRVGAYARGDRQPWLLEVVAGRCDSGQSPEDVARREAEEEAGLTLGQLDLIARYYPSPGTYSEYVYSYVGRVDLSRYHEGTHGLGYEGEDIATHLLDVDQVLPLVRSGEANNAPLIMSILWLEINRERLHKEWTGA